MKYFSVVQFNNDNKAISERPVSETGSIDINEECSPCESCGTQTDTVLTVSKTLPGKNAVRLVIEETNWDDSNYIFAPAALYNGNKFTSLHKDYPPMLTKEEALLYRGENVISDVPRLEKDNSGCAQLNVGDLSIPCFGYYCQKKHKGYLMFFKQENELGNFGITVQEDKGNKTAKFILSSPCVRTPYKYGMCTTLVKSDDTGAVLKAGDKITFSCREYEFECDTVDGFLNKFFEYRRIQNLPKSHPHRLPWNQAFRLIEEKYNSRNWVEDLGFYTSSEATSGICRQWQTGWVGGAINTLPALVLGNEESKEKSRRTLDFVFTKLQHESGFLYGIFCDGRPYGDSSNAENTDIVLMRKNTDALYYLAKQLLYLRKEGEEIKPLWYNGLLHLANAFISFYKQNGELGQFIDINKFEPFVYGSAGAGLICAGLALCASFFDDPSYLETAKEIGDSYYNGYVAKGYSTGGPGEILACPDSESAFALLESFVTLYRFTNDKKWLKYAEDTASLCASWCVGYDYNYKSDTQFFERRVATTGAVWASVQNKHAAPGICTMSGESLLHLYRATGNEAYLELLKDIAHNITQFVSTPENPAYASYVWHNKPAHRQKLANRRYVKAVHYLSSKSSVMKKALKPIYDKVFNPVGRINERVNLSDWEGTSNVGELPIGSCWCEVAAMLTYLEIPAVYIKADTGFCFALDHIECTVKDVRDSDFTAELYNPTDYDVNYRIFIDTEKNCDTPLLPNEALQMKNVFLNAGQRTQLKINRR